MLLLSTVWQSFWRGESTCQGTTVPSSLGISKPQCVYDYLEVFMLRRWRFYFMCLNIYMVKWTALWVSWSHIMYQVLRLLDVMEQVMYDLFPGSLKKPHCEASLSWRGEPMECLKHGNSPDGWSPWLTRNPSTQSYRSEEKGESGIWMWVRIRGYNLVFFSHDLTLTQHPKWSIGPKLNVPFQIGNESGRENAFYFICLLAWLLIYLK